MTTFRHANLQDFDACWAVIDAARWKMLDDGRHQWTAEYPSREQITNDIQQGHAYVLADGNDVKAYAVVIANGEPADAHTAPSTWFHSMWRNRLWSTWNATGF